MGVKKIPAQEVEVCDRCGDDRVTLRKCLVCKGDFCLICEGIVPGSGGHMFLCRECSQRNDVRNICEQFSPRLSQIYEERNRLLESLADK